MILNGVFEFPANAHSIIVFAHGSDSRPLNPRNRLVARSLLQRGYAVLLPDLTNVDEDESGAANASQVNPDQDDIHRSADRLTAIIDWLAANPATRNLRIGLFGGRDGAAAAMIAAARRPAMVHALVSRGGRPDLAAAELQDVQAPTLMLVGSKDQRHLDHNRQAEGQMRGHPMLEVIQGASHLFGEPGKLEQVASITYLWFQRNLARCG